jgi:beta-phosphoglucomutase family hydrolase
VRAPDGIRAWLFDMDGVLTKTAVVHAKAWKEAFDPVLAEHGQAPFDAHAEYEAHVDGKPRRDGVRSLLVARGIEATDALVGRIADAKQERIVAVLERDGVEVFDDAVRLLRRVRDAGHRTGLVTSSANARAALGAAGIEELFDAWVDGRVVDSAQLAGKPAPDTFLHAAGLLDMDPSAACVLEDALAGVEAGRAGRFGWTVGVDRTGHADELRAHGADWATADLDEVQLP